MHEMQIGWLYSLRNPESKRNPMAGHKVKTAQLPGTHKCVSLEEVLQPRVDRGSLKTVLSWRRSMSRKTESRNVSAVVSPG